MKVFVLAVSFCAFAGLAAAAEPDDVRLDCSPGYAKLTAAIEALPGIEPNPTPVGSPYRSLAHPPSYTVYTFTLAGAPGHPAIVKRRVAQEGGNVVMKESACGYGDAAGFAELKRAFGVLDAEVKQSFAK